jgi:hypothetical protein
MHIGDLVICGEYIGIVRSFEGEEAVVYLSNGLIVNKDVSKLKNVSFDGKVFENFPPELATANFKHLMDDEHRRGVFDEFYKVTDFGGTFTR